MEILLRPWRHYADFAGRSTRREYWFFTVTWWGGMVLCYAMMGLILGASSGWTFEDNGMSGAAIPFVIILAILALAGIIPSWAVSIRRIHDMDQSGWLVLLTLIPYLGFLFSLLFGLLPPTKGENSYGFDPRDPDPGDTDEMVQVFR